MAEQFCLKWNNYQLSLTSAFKHILEEEDYVDVTLSAEGKNLKGHKVVLSACSAYFQALLRGISPWQHPVLVLKDISFNDLQSILEFIYLGEVNLEQDRLESFLKTAEVLSIKGLTDGIKSMNDTGGGGSGMVKSEPMEKEIMPNHIVLPSTPQQLTPPLPLLQPAPPLQQQTANIVSGLMAAAAATAAAVSTSTTVVNGVKQEVVDLPTTIIDMETVPSGKKKRLYSDNSSSNDGNEYEEPAESMVIDDYADPQQTAAGGGDEPTYSAEHIIVSGDPVTIADLNRMPPPPPGVKENLGHLHKRCPVCHMIMLKKNLSRHVRDQHTLERPRSVCPICQKTYKTSDWLKDHIRRGHGYTKEDTDELMAKIKLDANMNVGSGDTTSSPTSNNSTTTTTSSTTATPPSSAGKASTRSVVLKRPCPAGVAVSAASGILTKSGNVKTVPALLASTALLSSTN